MGVIRGHESGQDWSGVIVMQSNNEVMTIMSEMTILGLVSTGKKSLAEYIMFGFANVAESKHCDPKDLLSDLYSKELLMQIFDEASAKVKDSIDNNKSTHEIDLNIYLFNKTLEIKSKVQSGELVICINRKVCHEILADSVKYVSFELDTMKQTKELVTYSVNNLEDIDNEQLLSIALLVRKVNSVNASMSVIGEFKHDDNDDDDPEDEYETHAILPTSLHILSDEDMDARNRASYQLN